MLSLKLAVLATLSFALQDSIDPCKRQPFRGRCPGVNGGPQTRSQFVLRYYVRDGECVSYPFGHCSRDENEPKLYRYKEECEEGCLRKKGVSNEVEEIPSSVRPKVVSPRPPSPSKKTECEKQRDAAEKNQVKRAFVPACTSDGEFQPLQCERGGHKCFCVDSEGTEIAYSRTEGKRKPDCSKILQAKQPTVNDCSTSPEQGPCSSTVSRWYYDENEKACKHFRFSGCGGNGNNYVSKGACEKRCAPPSNPLKCLMGKEPLRSSSGELINCGRTACPSGFKCSTIQHTSVCCPDVEKFKEAGVLHSGMDPQVCGLAKERGPCDRYELRFYYNSDLKECKYFFYGGCEGNRNNFEKVEDCERTCIQAVTAGPPKGSDTSVQATVKTTTGGITSEQTTASSTTVRTPLGTTRAVELRVPVNTESSATTGEALLPENRCMHPKDPGDCSGQFIRWYWNQKSKTCEVFTYTGCNGNGNNFASKEECLGNCRFEELVVPDLSNICEHEIDSGECKQSFQRYAYDKIKNECRSFVYGGCGGNGNNFANASECTKRCVKTETKKNPCEQPVEVGECSGIFTRYAFDASANECRRFTYGGCGGNENNFATIEECSKICLRIGTTVHPVPRRPENKDNGNQKSEVLQITVTTSTSLPPSGTPEPPEQASPVSEKDGVSESSEASVANHGLGEKCTQSVDPGPCTNFVVRYYYNLKAGKCEQFRYGGCAGNKNHFFTRRECDIHCGRFTKKIISGSEHEKIDASTVDEKTAIGHENVHLVEEQLMPTATEEAINEGSLTNASTSSSQMETQKEAKDIEKNSKFVAPSSATIAGMLSVPENATVSSRVDTTPHGQTLMITLVNNRQSFSSSSPNNAEIVPDHENIRIPLEELPESGYEVYSGNAVLSTKVPKVEGTYSSEEEPLEDRQLEGTVTQLQPATPVAIPARPSQVTVDNTASRTSSSGADEVCSLPPDVGNCFEYAPRWFYNSRLERCEQFSYGSCGGNSNNFLDRQSCELRCQTVSGLSESQVPSRCSLPKEEGFGNGYNVKWYFNIRNLRCEQMVYRGSGGNDNQFSTLGSCQQSCVLSAVKATDTPSPQMIEETAKQPIIYETSESAYHHRASTIVQPVQTPSTPVLQKPMGVANANIEGSPKVPKPPTDEATSFREPPPPVSATQDIFSPIKEVVKSESTYSEPSEVSRTAVIFEMSRTPSCANGELPITMANGRPMLCLPGKNQCPQNSECFFNGINFFCCPNADDPYDKHIFGGYNGDEEKNGYKSIRKELNIRNINSDWRRTRRQSQDSVPPLMELVVQSSRFDGDVLGQYSRAAAVPQQIKSHPCMQTVDPGPCKEAHLRYFFDRKAKACRLFYYGGCEGNSNNFATETDCELKCKTEAQSEVVPPGMCPNGRLPLGENVPVLCGNLTESIGCPVGYYCTNGPPEVCCPDDTLNALDLQKIITESKKSSNVRYAPPLKVRTSFNKNEGVETDKAKRESTKSLDGFLSKICPDGSDALMDNNTEKIIRCGYGSDGEAFCPIGFYCSINDEKGWRMCCPLAPSGNNIPPPPVSAPYFGHRKANPGEIIDRGSLPSDLKPESVLSSANLIYPESRKTVISDLQSFANAFKGDDTQSVPQRSFVTAGTSYTISEKPAFGKMMMKPGSKLQQHTNFLNTEGKENDGVQIDIGSTEDPFDVVTTSPGKSRPDRSVCMLGSSEGRACREDEPMPRTNLQYAYSRKDRRCKLFFYKGCGGNDNRFETKRQCEALCLGI